MPMVFAEIGDFIFTYIDVAVADAIATILEYAAIAALLNAAQHALNPPGKSGVGAGILFVGDGDDT